MSDVSSMLVITQHCPVHCCFTGSQVYGNPTPESDVDVVVLLSREEVQALRAAHPTLVNVWRGENKDGYGSVAVHSTVRHLKMNFILVTTQKQFDLWTRGTAECVRLAKADTRGYIERHTAVAVFQRLEEEMFPDGYED